jgi:hypothetical protein
MRNGVCEEEKVSMEWERKKGSKGNQGINTNAY